MLKLKYLPNRPIPPRDLMPGLLSRGVLFGLLLGSPRQCEGAHGYEHFADDHMRTSIVVPDVGGGYFKVCASLQLRVRVCAR